MSEVLLREQDGAVCLLTMNRPDKRNALDNALTASLVQALRDADADDSVHAIVLTGAGQAFCAGADIGEFRLLTPDRQHLVEQRAQLTTTLHGLFPRLTKPVVTAINGAAMGGGAGLALAGDLAVMSASARLGYPEVSHGLVAAIVMTNLVRQVGRKAAFELVGLGKPIGAERALELGMINRIANDDAVLGVACELAQALAAVSRPAMMTTKQLFYEVAEQPFEVALEAGRAANERMRAFRKG